MSMIYRILANPLARKALRELERITLMDRNQLMSLATEDSEELQAALEAMKNLGLISETPQLNYQLTTRGKICLILNEMLEGGSIKEGVRKLSYFIGKEFELLTENITRTYLEILNKNRVFQNLYFCSPWIRLRDRDREILRTVVKASRASLGEINIHVIVRPPDTTELGREIECNLRWLRVLRSDISLVRDLHAKLYIAEPGPNGGKFFAIFGSENLTGSRNIELGIKIENTEILDKLVRYFFDVFNQGEPYIG